MKKANTKCSSDSKMAFCTIDHQATSIDQELKKFKDVVNPPIYFGSLRLEHDPSWSMFEVFPLPQLQPYQTNQGFKFVAAQAKKIYNSYEQMYNCYNWYGDFSEKFKVRLKFGSRYPHASPGYMAFGFSISEILEQIPSMIEARLYYHDLKHIPKKHYDQVVEDLKNYITIHLNVFGLI